MLHYFITAHEQTQLNRVCYFRFLMCSLLPEDLHSELILETDYTGGGNRTSFTVFKPSASGVVPHEAFLTHQ